MHIIYHILIEAILQLGLQWKSLQLLTSLKMPAEIGEKVYINTVYSVFP